MKCKQYSEREGRAETSSARVYTVFPKDIIVTGAALLLLSACSHNTKQADETSSASSKSGTASQTKSASEESGAKSSGSDKAAETTKAGEASKADGTTKADSTEKAVDKEKTGDASSTAKNKGSGKINISLADLSSEVPICSVAGTDIKVGDYRRMLRLQQIQSNQTIVMDPSVKAKLLDEAKRRGIVLSQEEKTKLVQAAHQQKGQNKKQFQEFLEQTKSTEQQFDDEIMKTGLAFKTSNTMMEETLLPDLVNRALLSQAAKEAGGEKEAMNKYLAFKQSQQYDPILKQTGFSADGLKEELLKTELEKIQLAKLEAKAKVSNAEVHKLFDDNRKQLKHGERIRLSAILIACPENNVGPISSVRNQVLKANPKLSGKELDATVAQVMEQAKQKALICLGQAKAGTDFAKLANENSNDTETQVKKTGGNLGFLERKDIIPDLANVVWNLKVGEVLPQIVKSDLGFNVYKVTGKEAAGDFKFAEVKDKLEQLAKQAKIQQVVEQWLEQRKRIVRVEFTPKFLAIANESAKPPSGKTVH